jgi:hypothetical protein
MHDPTEFDDREAVDNREARPTRSSGLSFVGLLAGAVMIMVLLGELSPGPSPRPPAAVAITTSPDLPAAPAPDVPIGVESLKRCPVQLGGLVVGEDLRVPGSALVRWDCDALKGPWSVVIRAAHGHFGVKSAVVTFPVDLVGSGVPSTRPQGGVWNPGARMLVWPLGGFHAQIVGDVGQATLENLATRIAVEGGKPRFQALDGFKAEATTPYRSPVVHEMRYDTNDLGKASTLGGGLVFTGVTSEASFETLAFETHAKQAGLVRGSPAIYSEGQVGNGILAWEPAPGLVHYIGYSGAVSSADAVEALRALADKGRLLTPSQWQTRDRYPDATKSG